MRIREANVKDFHTIVEIYNHAVDDKFATADTEYVSVESKKAWLAQHSPKTYPIFLYEESGNVVGWCALSPHRPGRKALRTVAEISYYVHKDHRRKGVGGSLISYTIDESKKLGFKNLISILLELNKTSIYILEKFGFEKWGLLPNVAIIGDVICGQYIYGKRINSE